MSEENILKNFVGILEDHFPEAETFRPRDIRLDKFMYVNDEEMDKRDEWAEDEVLLSLAFENSLSENSISDTNSSAGGLLVCLFFIFQEPVHVVIQYLV